MNEYLTAEDSVLPLDREEGDGRSLIIRLLSWGEVADTAQGRETFERGAFSDVDPTGILIESERHDGAIIGRGERLEEAEDGAYLHARVSDVTAGRDLLTLVRDRVLSRASISFRPTDSIRRPDGVIARRKADIRAVALLARGAYRSAEIVATRSEPMTDTTTVDPTPAVETVDLTPINTRLDEMDQTIRTVAANAAPAPSQDLLREFKTFGEAWLVATEDKGVRDALERALYDQITTDVPGLITPGNNVSGILFAPAFERKAIGAWGSIPLPAQGMSFEWPYEDEANSTFDVAEQAAQKDELATGSIKIAQGTAPVRTFGGAQDISFQTLQRSSPSYLEAALRIYARVWAKRVETAFCTILESTATKDTLSMTGVDDDADAAALRQKLIDLSIAIDGVLGTPASIVHAASDVYGRIAGNTVLADQAYPVQNVSGVASAASLNVNVSGLTITHNPILSAGTMLVSAPGAAFWAEDGPRIIDAQNVAQLGHDYAIYSFGNGAIAYEAALIDVAVTLA